MNRTYHKNAFKTKLTFDDPQQQDAYALLECQEFTASSLKSELLCPTCSHPTEDLLEEYVAAAHAYYPASIEHSRAQDLCRDKDGLVQGRMIGKHFTVNPILDDMEAKLKPIEEAYWHSLNRLDAALSVEIVVSIKEALKLAGVKDAALSDEICRCVMMGGTLFDGLNVKSPPQKVEGEMAATA
jgi:hypothetical protein